MDKSEKEFSDRLERFFDDMTALATLHDVPASFIVITDNFPPCLIARPRDENELCQHVDVAAAIFVELLTPGSIERMYRNFEKKVDYMNSKTRQA